MTEHFIRHGDMLTHVSVTTDPVYLTEPLVKSETFMFNGTIHGQARWTWSCVAAIEVYEEEGAVLQYLPGENEFLNEISFYQIPMEAMRGGAETLYSSFIE